MRSCRKKTIALVAQRQRWPQLKRNLEMLHWAATVVWLWNRGRSPSFPVHTSHRGSARSSCRRHMQQVIPMDTIWNCGTICSHSHSCSSGLCVLQLCLLVVLPTHELVPSLSPFQLQPTPIPWKDVLGVNRIYPHSYWSSSNSHPVQRNMEIYKCIISQEQWGSPAIQLHGRLRQEDLLNPRACDPWATLWDSSQQTNKYIVLLQYSICKNKDGKKHWIVWQVVMNMLDIWGKYVGHKIIPWLQHTHIFSIYILCMICNNMPSKKKYLPRNQQNFPKSSPNHPTYAPSEQ